MDFRIIRQDNETIWIHEKIKYDYNAFGKLIRRHGIIQDVTHRKLNELKLKESEEVSTTFLSGLLDEQYRIIQPDGRIRWVWTKIFPILDQFQIRVQFPIFCV